MNEFADIRLDEAKVKFAVEQLQNLNLANVNIKECEELLFPLFKGLTTVAPVFEPGLMIYRSRICGKPTNLSELTYPPDKDIKTAGRSNVPGQSMFYGSVGKLVPLFEINAEVGDTVVITRWRTTERIILNHVGYTQQIVKDLNTQRNLDEIYKFVQQTKSHNDLNALVYNFLASIFSRKVLKGGESLYTLTNAISNKLLGNNDAFDGIMYPTVAMFYNADNIVLRPASVDKKLKFLTAEFYRVHDIKGLDYTIDLIDSAVEADSAGQLVWTGKKLSYQLLPSQTMHLRVEQGEWVSRHPDNSVVDFSATEKIDVYRNEFHRKYLTSFSETFKFSKEVELSTPGGTITSLSTLHVKGLFKSKFLSYYIPESHFAADIGIALLNNLRYTLQLGSNYVLGDQTPEDEIPEIKVEDIPFNNEVHIYTETHFDFNILKSRFPQLHLKFDSQHPTQPFLLTKD